jgi:hypothetical protein
MKRFLLSLLLCIVPLNTAAEVTPMNVTDEATPQSWNKFVGAAAVGASLYIGKKILKVISEDEKKIKNTISDLSYRGISVKRESIGGKTYGMTYFIKCWGEMRTMNRNEKKINRLHWLCIKKDLIIGLVVIGLSSVLRIGYDGLKNPV